MIFLGATAPEVLGLMRHELEHMRQKKLASAAFEFAAIVRDSLELRYANAGNGSGSIYNTLPNEVDANHASAALVDERFGEQPEAARWGEHGVLLRLRSDAGKPADLGRRLLAFAAVHPDEFEQEVRRTSFSLNDALRFADPDGPALWSDLRAARTVSAARNELRGHLPTAASIYAAGERPARAFDDYCGRVTDGARLAATVIAAR